MTTKSTCLPTYLPNTNFWLHRSPPLDKLFNDLIFHCSKTEETTCIIGTVSFILVGFTSPFSSTVNGRRVSQCLATTFTNTDTSTLFCWMDNSQVTGWKVLQSLIKNSLANRKIFTILCLICSTAAFGRIWLTTCKPVFACKVFPQQINLWIRTSNYTSNCYCRITSFKEYDSLILLNPLKCL